MSPYPVAVIDTEGNRRPLAMMPKTSVNQYMERLQKLMADEPFDLTKRNMARSIVFGVHCNHGPSIANEVIKSLGLEEKGIVAPIA